MIATSDAAQTAAHLRSFGKAATRLADALVHAADIQWLAPAAPVAERIDVRPPAGGVKRPTETTATDSRRLRVRAAVISGELAAQEIAAKANAAAAELEAAVTSWAGVRA